VGGSGVVAKIDQWSKKCYELQLSGIQENYAVDLRVGSFLFHF
jgi:hypothetical protein